MRLSSLRTAGIEQIGDGDPEISGITADSRTVVPGSLFAALSGARLDGSRFVTDAVARGAAAILVGSARADEITSAAAGMPVLVAAEPRLALSRIAARVHPRQPGTVVAVTGTNGKTSIAEFTRQIFSRLGYAAASLGTLGVVRADGAVYGSLTTPDPVTLHRTLDGLAGDGITHLALEASSHGLDQYRLDAVRLSAAAFNNLGRDHLDYHPSIEAYLAAKLRLFTELLPDGKPAVINLDGPFADRALAAARERGLPVLTTGTSGETLCLLSVERAGFAQQVRIAHAARVHDLEIGLVGDYQASNALVAAGLAIACGCDPEAAVEAIGSLTGVPGRLEIVGRVAGGLAVVDYAHKPEALAAALAALRPFASGRLICVFGCGGDRDRGKRPIMGRIAIEGADVVIVTDDNPRSEVPGSIRAEVLAGAPGAREIGDRAEAIAAGIGMLADGDVLLVAGKGHESGQIVADRTLPFSDHQYVRAAVAAREKR